MKEFKFNLQLFAEMNTNLTSSSGLTEEMKTYYSDYLIDNAVPKLVHDQFGQKHPIPKGGGKTIQFRKYSPLPKLTTPLQEGVTPDGQSLNMSVIEATVEQYGGYVTLSDMLILTAIDNNLVQATKLLGAQAGATLDTITREVLNGGTNVVYAGGKEGRADLDETSLISVDDVRKAVRKLKSMNAETIDGSFVGIINPDVAYDLMSDPKWINVKTYSDPEGIYQGELGKIENVRFVESTEAKIWAGAGAGGRAVYSTLILGDNAYGVTDIEGGGLQHIVKQLGSAGTADALDQRATAGWKATKVAERLVEEYMVRIESASTFNPTKNN
jgi:N4-gp56 family major capsid protein